MPWIDPDQRLVYSVWFESVLLRAYKSRMTPALTAALQQVGLDLTQPLKQTYTAAQRQDCARLLREHLFVGQSVEQVELELGHAVLSGFLETAIGKSFGDMFRQLGPRAFMKRVGDVMSSTSNYVSVESIERAPFRWEARIEGADFGPAYFRAIAIAGLNFCHDGPIDVQLVSHVGREIVLSCSWTVVSER